MSPCLPVVMRKHDEGDGIEIGFFIAEQYPLFTLSKHVNMRPLSGTNFSDDGVEIQFEKKERDPWNCTIWTSC